MRWVAVVAAAFGAVIACTTGFNDDPPVVGVPEAGAGDATATGPCDPRATFVTAVRLGVSTAGTFDGPPSLTRNELTLAWERAGALWHAAPNFEAGTPYPLPAGSSPALSPDGTLLVFSQTIDGGTDLFASADAVVALAALNTPATERGASFSADGTMLYFSSSRMGPFGSDEDADSLFVASLGLDGGYVNPVPLTDATTNSKLAIGFNPTPTADGKNIYFARRQAAGTDHVFVADVAADGVTLSNIAPIAAVDPSVFSDDTTNQFPGMISSDNCRLYFASDTTGDSDVYVASRR